MTKIVLIENQFTQFTKIRSYLVNAGEGYNVFPGKKHAQFKQFLDLVRIFLNKRYGGIEDDSRRAKAFGEILRSIEEVSKPDIIIIDNALVGYHNPENGIFLAREIRKHYQTIPIIFLSRTELNAPDTKSSLQQISEPKIWIHKGYAGEEILNEAYFKERVINEIPKLFERTNQGSSSSSLTGTDLTLTGDAIERIVDALLDAFPQKTKLEQLVKYGLNESLDKIAGGGDLEDVCFDLVKWARAHGKLLDLLKKARARNPDNICLAAIAQEFLP